MNLRLKMLLAQAPFALALVAIGSVAVSSVATLGRHSQIILQENYRSVLAAQRMREAIERLEDLAVLSPTNGALESSSAAAAHGDQFEAELRAAEGNVTEPGESEALQELRRRWEVYRQDLHHFTGLADREEARGFVQTDLEPAAATVREQAQAILDINQDAMVRKSERAQHEAGRIRTLMVSAALAALIVGAFMSSVFTNRLLQPFEILARTVKRLSEGDFEARVSITGRDEVAGLANDINTMAARLNQYQCSSLGDLLLAQEASQSAIDSLPDPVLVFDLSGSVLTVNQAAEAKLGLSLDAKDGHPPLDRLDPALRDCLERLRRHVLGGKGSSQPRGFEDAVRVCTPAGEYYLLPLATPVHSADGALIGATAILQDVTRLRRADDLHNSLVATVADEFREPLTSLRLAIHLCLEQTAGPLTDNQADLLYAARAQCERLQAVVDELLSLARIPTASSAGNPSIVP